MAQFVTCNLRCPVCSAALLVDEPVGRIPFGVETDFRPLFAAGADPLPARLHCCPGCSYAAYRDGFVRELDGDEDLLLDGLDGELPGVPRVLPAPRVRLPEADAADALRRCSRSGELTRGIVEPGAAPHASSRYRVAARVYEHLSENEPLGGAHFSLGAAWCARGEGDRTAERRAVAETLARILPALERGLPLPERVRLGYLAGELARRVGDFTRAVHLLSQVGRETEMDEADLVFGVLAERQLMLASVRSDVPARIPDELLRRGRSGGVLLSVDEDGMGDDGDDGGTSSLS